MLDVWIAALHEVEARCRRAAIAAGLRELAANDLLKAGLPRLGGSCLDRTSDLLDFESFDRDVGEDRIVHCM